jgi:hypothetical protein
MSRNFGCADHLQLHPRRPRKGNGRVIYRQSYFWQDPEGEEHYLGAYASENSAKAILTRFLAPDFRALCTGPYTKEEEQP